MITAYKIDIQKPSMYLYANNEQSDNEIKKTITITKQLQL